MTEYITKEQAIDEVWDAFTSRDDPDLGRVIEENIERLPGADVAPVVQARWIEDKCAFMHCSRCGYENDWEWETPYCPHCGARMDGDQQCK